MSDLETLKAQHPAIQAVLDRVQRDGNRSLPEERAVAALADALQQHEATIAELGTALSEANGQRVKMIELAESLKSDLAAAQATIRDLENQLAAAAADLVVTQAIIRNLERELEEEREVNAIYGKCVALIFSLRKASTSLLQRKLNLGYGRASRIIARMQRDGLIGEMEPLSCLCPLLFDASDPNGIVARHSARVVSEAKKEE